MGFVRLELIWVFTLGRKWKSKQLQQDGRLATSTKSGVKVGVSMESSGSLDGLFGKICGTQGRFALYSPPQTNLTRMFLRLFCFLSLLGFAQPMAAQAPDTVKIGAYVLDIYDINLSENSFSTQFWVWFNYTNPRLQPLESLEIPNAKEINSPNTFVDEKNGVQWQGKKYTAVVKKEWDIRHFPFDKQKMTIEMEESGLDMDSLVYVADIKNTLLSGDLTLRNWEIVGYEMIADSKHYRSTFGDPELEEGSTYAHATLNIFIKRNGSGLFFSLFTGMYVAFFISCLVFFIAPNHVDPRFGLSVGGLFAAVGNKYIVDSVLPQSTTFTLVDKLHIVTYFFLLLCIVLSVVSLRMWDTGKQKRSKRFDRLAWKIILSVYVLVNVVLVWHACLSGKAQ